VGDSFCYFAVGVNGPFIVQDAASDPRTAGHPAIGPWGVGAWAGFPIVSADGQAIGTMCVIDAKPRVWQPSELETLAILARAVSNEVNLRVSLHVARGALETAQAALARSSELARGLQDSLLPPLLRPVPGLDTAALPPALIRRADGRIQEVGTIGPLLGVFDRVRLTDVRFRLPPGDLILLYTDGACEARADPDRPGPREPMFDDEALTRTLADSHGLDAAATPGTSPRPRPRSQNPA
jgi:stage II sporulation SpoE-like protein/GAF domain-containing protein